MNFKRFAFLSTALVLLNVHRTEAEALQNYPLGVVLRPSLIQRFFDRVNKAKDGIPIDACISEDLDIRIVGKARVNLSNPAWVDATTQDLALSAMIDNLVAEAKFGSPCLPPGDDEENPLDVKRPDLEKVLGSAHISLPNRVQLKYTINPWKIYEAEGTSEENSKNTGVHLNNESIDNFAHSLVVSSPELPNLSNDLNNIESKKLLVRSGMDILDREFSKWLRTRLRGLAFFEYLSETFNQAEFWKDGIQIERGAISLNNPSERLRQSQLVFGFYPRQDQFIALGSGGLELYFNSIFLNNVQTDHLSGHSGADRKTKLSVIRNKFLTNPEIPDASFSRPILSERDSDVTLILPEALINGALQRLYQQDLRQFTTNIAFGKQAKGLITDEVVDVSLRVQLESDQAPQILFESNRLNLSVSNYFLSIGTFIEDRLIPSTQVKALVNVTASLDVSGPTVNLSIQPGTFKLELEKGERFQNRLTEGDLEFVESVSNGLWKDFFVKYPQLPLFYTIFKTADSRIKITGLDVENELVLLHFNFEEIQVKL